MAFWFIVSSSTRAQPGAEQIRRSGADSVHHQMVGMAVVAVRVVVDEHIGVLLAQDPDQPLGDRPGVRIAEGPRVTVGVPAGHPGVGETQPDDPVDADDLGGVLVLGPTVGRQPGGVEAVGHDAEGPVGREDLDDTVAALVRHGHGPGGLAGLVVRMRVEEDPVRHPAILPPSPDRPRPSRPGLNGARARPERPRRLAW